MSMGSLIWFVGFLAQASCFQLVKKHWMTGSNLGHTLCGYNKSMTLANHYNGYHGLPMTNNLGGHGPETGEESLRFSDVFPGSGKKVDLKITTDHKYKPKNTNSNGLNHGVYGQINILAGTRNNDFVFQFIDSSTGEPVTAPPFLMTFLDFDQDKLGSASEYVTFRGFSKYYLMEEEASEITVEELADGQLRTHATAYGNSGDNPVSPLLLTNAMKKRVITLEFGEVSEFFVNMASEKSTNGKPGGRNFMFGGPTSLTCPEQPSCEGYVCPANHVLVPNAEYLNDDGAKVCCLTQETCSGYTCPAGKVLIEKVSTTFCADTTCESSDSDICCEEASPMCHKTELVLDNLTVNNLAGKGPQENAPSETMTFGNVFPNIGYVVDMVISAVNNEYEPKNIAKNGVDGNFGVINQQAGTTVELIYKFVRADGGELANVDFLFSVFDLDTSAKGSTEYATVRGYSGFKTSEDSHVVAEPDGESKGSFFGSTEGFDTDNPKDLYNLTATQKARLVTFEFKNTSKLSIALGSSSGGRGGRNILFAGGSALYCDSTA